MRRADAEAKAMAIGNIADVLRLKTVSPLQKRRAAAVGKWHSACPEVRLYRSKVGGEKDIAPMRADDNIGVPFGAGKDCYSMSKGGGL